MKFAKVFVFASSLRFGRGHEQNFTRAEQVATQVHLVFL